MYVYTIQTFLANTSTKPERESIVYFLPWAKFSLKC